MIFDRISQLFKSKKHQDEWPGIVAAPTSRIITGRGVISIGKGTRILNAAEISTEYGGTISIGENCEIHTGALILSYGGAISIGNNCSINPYSIIYGHGGLIIGDGVRIAAHTVVIPANHNFADITRPIYQQGLTKKGIVIEDDVWIGAGVRIMDGVIIRQGCVIGAGSVVTRDTPPFTVSLGVPAKVVSSRLPSNRNATLSD